MACWAKEISGLVTLDRHVRRDVPVECIMMAISRLGGWLSWHECASPSQPSCIFAALDHSPTAA